MDLWVVVAAAGAGYLAKFWQNISRDRESSSEFSSGDSNFENSDSQTCPFRRLAQRKNLDRDVSTDKSKVLEGRFSATSHLDGDSTPELASTSGSNCEKFGSLRNYENCNVNSVPDLPSRLPNNENCRENGDRITASQDIYLNSGDILTYPEEFGSVHDIVRNRGFLRAKHSYRHYAKPLNSLESCLVSQLCKERIAMEEFVLSSFPTPSTPTTRPLLVTDGSQIISRASGDSFRAWMNAEENKLHKETDSENKETLFGVPRLQKIESLELRKKMKVRTGKGRSGRLSCSSKMVNGKHFYSRGSPDGSLLFCLGLSIGVISSIIANKKEVDELKELLKQTENLVQDLQEELEMKDSLTVKELENENYESRDTCDDSSVHDREQNVVSHGRDLNNKFYDQKAGESLESMSKIEAELEAELERLGLNMNSSSLERRLSDLVELDPDFVADFAQGELRANMVGGQTFGQPDANQDASSTSTTHSANYAVSPRELSIRLHEVIQSRLEKHVRELEIALQNSQKEQLLLLGSEPNNSWSEFSIGKVGSSSTQGSPNGKEYNPLVINLSGEALDAYNEAYEELMKINEAEADSPSSVYAFDQKVFQDHNADVNGSIPDLSINTGKLSRELIYGNERTFEEHIPTVQGSDSALSVCGDEDSDRDDEIEKLLIKQIVEKSKKGSPVVVNAQRMLFSWDDNEHCNETKESFAVYEDK